MEKASKVFVKNEPVPLQKRINELNQWIGMNIISFTDYNLGCLCIHPVNF